MGLKKIVETAERDGEDEPLCSILFSEAIPGEYVRVYEKYEKVCVGNSAVYAALDLIDSYAKTHKNV